MLVIKVPATTANMGPGFDSLGMAVSLYLELSVVGEAKEWFIETDLPFLPKDSRNLIIRTALKVHGDLKPHHLKMVTNIPTTRGLGSSSSAIVAGIELANQLAGLQLSTDQKIQLATKFEGHPDNVVPAIVGSLVASAYTNKRVYWSKIKVSQLKCVACISPTPLSTKESRHILPEQISLAKGAEGSAISNVLIAQLSRGYYKYIKHVIEKDVFHEPFRMRLVPELKEIRQLLKKELTYGTYLSGAGPTVMTLVPEEEATRVQRMIKGHYPTYEVLVLDVEQTGLSVSH